MGRNENIRMEQDGNILTIIEAGWKVHELIILFSMLLWLCKKFYYEKFKIKY